MELDFLREFKLGSAAQGFAKNFGLITQLRIIIDVLKVASTAAPEVSTAGFDALRRGSQYSVELGANESRSALNRRGLDLFARNDERYESSLALAMHISRQSRQAIAAVHQLFNVQ